VQNRAPSKVQKAVLSRDGDYVELTDLDTAGYLFTKKLYVSDAWKVSRFKYLIRFYDPDKLAEGLAMEFVNSICADYADAICRLKKVIHRFYGRDDKHKDASCKISQEQPPVPK
jgi:hypothetical protein